MVHVEVAEALTSEKGKRFFERHKGNTDIPIHIFNDTAHTIACFHAVAKDPAVHNAAADGGDVAYSTSRVAAQVSTIFNSKILINIQYNPT